MSFIIGVIGSSRVRRVNIYVAAKKLALHKIHQSESSEGFYNAHFTTQTIDSERPTGF